MNTNTNLKTNAFYPYNNKNYLSLPCWTNCLPLYQGKPKNTELYPMDLAATSPNQRSFSSSAELAYDYDYDKYFDEQEKKENDQKPRGEHSRTRGEDKKEGDINTSPDFTRRSRLFDLLPIPHPLQNEQKFDPKAQPPNEEINANNSLHSNTLAKEHKLHPKQRPIHFSISLKEYYQIIDLVENNGKKSSRIRFALCLLYITGLRISTLLVFKGFHIQNLLKHRTIEIPQNKNGFKKHFVCIENLGLSLLEQRESDFLSLMEGKDLNDFVFTAYSKKERIIKKERALSRVKLNIDVNSVLKEASVIFNKKIRSHNLRVSYITDMFANRVPIEKVRAMIGHKDIKTTSHYYKSRMNGGEAKEIIKSLENTRKISLKE